MSNKNILAICGSAGEQSACLSILRFITDIAGNGLKLTIFDGLRDLPHFRPELTMENVPKQVLSFRELVSNADGIIICTPEYVMGIPSGLKNAIEWCVSTTLFYQKPVGLITASLSGLNSHEQLQVVMNAVNAFFKESTMLLIQGVNAKVKDGRIVDEHTRASLMQFLVSFSQLLEPQ
jgi:chromate reductase, NAD(P)H dehydrogenase (quinone)